MTLNKVADASQDERETSFKFIEEVHNCPTVWDISSIVYKDIKNKQTEEMEQLWDKVSFVQSFLFLNRFLFLLFSISDGLTVIRQCNPLARQEVQPPCFLLTLYSKHYRKFHSDG